MQPFPIEAEPVPIPPTSTDHRVIAAFTDLAAGAGPPWLRVRACEDVLVEAKSVDERVRNGERLPLAGALVAVPEARDAVDRVLQAGAVVLGYVDVDDPRPAADPVLGVLDAVVCARWPQRCGDAVTVRPTRGLVPGMGVAHVLAVDVAVGQRVAAALTGPDNADPGSRVWPPGVRFGAGENPRIAVPAGEAQRSAGFAATVDTVRATGGSVVPVDVAASLDRWRCRGRVLAGVDAVLLPLHGSEPGPETLLTCLDVAATAVADRGVTDVAVLTGAFDDQIGLDLVAQLTGVQAEEPYPDTGVDLVVSGAYLRGQPLNDRLTGVGARFAGFVRTAPGYRMVALPGEPPQAGVLRAETGGAVLSGERWVLSEAGLGRFLAGLAEPMTLGSIDLACGETATGLLCEPSAAAGATDITRYGGWRAYLRHLSTQKASVPARRPASG